MQVKLSETRVNDQLDYIYTFFKPEAEQKGINLILKKGLFSGTLITDREKIYAVLTNLVKNAIKFTSAGSIEIGYNQKGSFLEFYVKDTGSGIPYNQQKIIFERFRQGSESLARSYEGAGLGLAISKAYIEMLGGKIWVESIPDEGSIFYFTLPGSLREENELLIQPQVSKTEEDIKINKLNILIVEDDPISTLLLRKTVEKYCRTINCVKTGKEAVDFCMHNDLDLILMDIQVPEMDGYEAMHRIREFNSKVLIIAQTAFALTGDKDKAIRAGFNDYIPKPLRSEELDALIKKHFAN